MEQYLLLVDNHLPTLQVIQEILEMSGYKVLTADNGLSALTLFNQHQEQVNLVITDLQMPPPDGLALLVALRSIRPQLKIILMTGKKHLVNTPTHPIHQTTSVLLKPFRAPQLLDLVTSILQS